jgi:hypothetical protein
MELLKKCSRCKVEKSLAEFCKNQATIEGLHWECNTCKTELYYLNKEKLFPKVPCLCGKAVDKYYLSNHLKTNIHKKLF